MHQDLWQDYGILYCTFHVVDQKVCKSGGAGTLDIGSVIVISKAVELASPIQRLSKCPHDRK